jgi:hypothetical protein
MRPFPHHFGFGDLDLREHESWPYATDGMLVRVGWPSWLIKGE